MDSDGFSSGGTIGHGFAIVQVMDCLKSAPVDHRQSRRNGHQLVPQHLIPTSFLHCIDLNTYSTNRCTSLFDLEVSEVLGVPLYKSSNLSSKPPHFFGL